MADVSIIYPQRHFPFGLNRCPMSGSSAGAGSRRAGLQVSADLRTRLLALLDEELRACSVLKEWTPTILPRTLTALRRIATEASGDVLRDMAADLGLADAKEG